MTELLFIKLAIGFMFAMLITQIVWFIEEIKQEKWFAVLFFMIGVILMVNFLLSIIESYLKLLGIL